MIGTLKTTFKSEHSPHRHHRILPHHYAHMSSVKQQPRYNNIITVFLLSATPTIQINHHMTGTLV